jgi:hypothetical protein
MQLMVCPHLGLDDDPTLTRTAATRSHRCYAQTPPLAPDVDQQSEFCFSGAFAQCPYYTSTPAKAVAPVRAPAAWRSPQVLDNERPRWLGWIWLVLSAVIVVAFAFVVITFGLDLLGPPASATPFALATVMPTASMPTASMPTALPARLPAATRVEIALSATFPTPTTAPGGQALTLTSHGEDAGWWASGDTRANHLGDSFLYAGRLDDQRFLSMVRFDLTRVPRGAVIEQATLRLTGLEDQRLDGADPGLWLVQLIAEVDAQDLTRADYVAAYSRPAAITLTPLRAADLAVGKANAFVLDETIRTWMAQQLLDGAASLTVRLLPAGDETTSLFAWDSGQGSESRGAAPELALVVGPPPPTPPPLPTKPFLVATLTPPPANVMTVVALAATATTVAETTGAYTPLPYQVYTPTPFPENLATVQAAAQARGLPPVLVDTPTPANEATAAYHAEYATAVALTTGAFTPVPTDYVTPVVIVPSPPAENVATAAARVLAVTAAAEAAAHSLLPTATPTPWPYNALLGVFVYATAIPENAETAVALNEQAILIARTTGTPTPLPWNALVITRVPAPVAATPTPIPLFISETEFTPTPTPTATGTPPSALPAEVIGAILFRSDRSGSEATYMLDPTTGSVTLITQPWVYTLARQQLAQAPGGEQAIVKVDNRGLLQIQAYAPTYNATRQLTALNGASYDPAWSPTGEWIAFASTDSGGDEIYRVTPDGSVTQRLTFNTWEWDKHPSWSPDGARIVFYSNRDTGRRQLWIMNHDGSGQLNLSSNEYNDWDPVWVR